MEYSSSIKQYNTDEPQKHYAQWKKPIQKITYQVIPFVWNVPRKQIYRDKTESSSYLGLWERMVSDHKQTEGDGNVSN